jgi:histidinol-phosphate/aromatic aminotransferase/cobyric acid decarboxylase-like protein
LHGGLDLAELRALGVAAYDVLDVSTSVNPYGPAPAVLDAIREVRVDVYPDPCCTAARAALARQCGVEAQRVVLGNGATDLLWTVARVLLAPGDTLLSCEPTFSELRAAATHAGARVLEWRADERDGFALDVHAIARAARDARARAVALCVPASPVGVLLAPPEIAWLAERIAPALLVLDQSFLALSTRPDDRRVALPDNVVAVRSLTKEHAIPGVRVGFLLAEPALATRIAVARPAWTVGSAAQAAAIAAVAAEDFVAATRARLLADAARLSERLRDAGYVVARSQTPYFVVHVGDAAPFRRELLRAHGVLVRDCTSFGMPAWVRVAARGDAAATRIVDGFAALAPRFATPIAVAGAHA